MPIQPKKVVVAMSGGVDSSVAACLLQEQGYEVLGLFMRTGVAEPDADAGAGSPDACAVREGQTSNTSADCKRDETANADRFLTGAARNARRTEETPAKAGREHRGCCSASDAADARFVAGMLGVPFYALNFERDFDQLIDYFADEYARGRTPNPCVVCNDRLKFGKIVDYADAVGARYIATGHYARVGRCDGRPVLMRGVDAQKDQSYVLFGLDSGILDRLLFPVGELTKTEVRAIADRLDLPNRDKPDSVEICFVPDRDYARVVRQRRPDAFSEGDVLDAGGNVIGQHKGIGQYTIGQRRGLGIAAGTPVYVTDINVERNTVTLGEGEALMSGGLIATRANFLAEVPAGPFRANVKIRYLHQATPATVELVSGDVGAPGVGIHESGAPSSRKKSVERTDQLGAAVGGRVCVTFDTPQRAVTPGQAVVFYDGDVVLGGAWIEQSVTSMG